MQNCSTVEIIRIREEVVNLMAIFAASQNPMNSDRTVVVETEVLELITSDLASATDKNDTTILPNDLNDTISTTGLILRYIYIYAICVCHFCTKCDIVP